MRATAGLKTAVAVAAAALFLTFSNLSLSLLLPANAVSVRFKPPHVAGDPVSCRLAQADCEKACSSQSGGRIGLPVASAIAWTV